jgi:hypothetical protein
MGWQSWLAMHHWGCWIHLYKTFMLRSCFPNRLHNTWTEWQFYGGGSLYIFIYNKWCLKREITLHVHTISQRHEISYMRQCCQYGLWKLEWSCWVPARMCVWGGMLMWAASLLYKKYISKYMISVLNLLSFVITSSVCVCVCVWELYYKMMYVFKQWKLCELLLTSVLLHLERCCLQMKVLPHWLITSNLQYSPFHHKVSIYEGIISDILKVCWFLINLPLCSFEMINRQSIYCVDELLSV